MPVALELSKEFYDRFGKGVVDEFVNSLNAVDASYRQEFRDLFDAKFQHLEARMDAKLAELKAELLRWMFLFWVGTMGTVLAIVKL